MGQEIAGSRFKYYDFHRFEKLLRQEMELLRLWFSERRFSTKRSIAGLELEAWLADLDGQPIPWNEQVISCAGSPDIVPELSRFNVEFNVAPKALAGRGLAELAEDLGKTWRLCEEAANNLGASVLSIGILPTVTDSMLLLAIISNMHRYQALNEQVLRMRQGRPLRLDVRGQESLVTEHRDVMLESAATSFQLHLQTPLEEAVRSYNAAMIASAPLVAIAGNSPFLFGKMLWEETRIPLFEQAVDLGCQSLPRVTFGSGYAEESLAEIFEENAARYPILLPLAMDSPSEHLAHLRLLNGTIWRWNRPLIGFDDDGTPHLRIEHRVMAAGPTLADMTANMAMFYGLVENLAHDPTPPESRLPFEATRENFYRAARFGLDAEVEWIQGAKHRLCHLILHELLPMAASGLTRLRVDSALIAEWLAIIEARARTGQTGAVWQRRYVERHGRDFAALTQAYRERQQLGEPVHTWPTDRCIKSVPCSRKRSMLRIIDSLPPGLLTAKATELADLLEQPTLIHLPGRRPEPLFVSILLHGNEDVGLLAIQAWFREHGNQVLPRALSLFIGNVAAAKENVRRLPNQPDYNRVWPGAERDDTPEHAMMRHIVDEMRARNVFASIDLHNNTGWNPHYTCVTHREDTHCQLAAIFGRTAVYFQRPRGVQTMAFAEHCPAVTCECGKVGDEAGVLHATEFLDACLHLAEIPRHPLPAGDLHLFHTVATVNIPDRVRLVVGESERVSQLTELDLILRGDLDRLNFQELKIGTRLGKTQRHAPMPLIVTDQSGRDVTAHYLRNNDGDIEVCKPVIPSMFTLNETVIRQDCLGYFMEELDRESTPSY
ncbi:MAG: succinylglutamate desuccinylase/aspartoacylase family protein [Planctomycetales bacterium]